MIIKDIIKVLNNRYRIIFDNSEIYLPYMTKYDLKKYNFKVNTEYNYNELLELKNTIELELAEKKIINILKFADKPEAYLNKKLKEINISDKVINRLIQKYKDYNYIDDEKYIKNFIIQQSKVHYKSIKEIKFKLYQQNISSELFEKILEKLEIEGQISDYESCKKIFENKKKKYKNYQDEYKIKQKFISYLMLKGFSYEIISEFI